MIIWMFVYLQLSNEYITYDTNVYQGFDYASNSFNCQSSSKTLSINFSGTFANVPQIILTSDKYDSEISPQFEFSITSVTVSDFSVKILCLTRRIYRYYFRWHAIDDPRIEIINCFNQHPALTQTISHSNPNALYGFVTITSFYTTGSTNFVLSISSITTTSVTVNLSSIKNLGQLGYQIVLGVDQSFGSYTTKSFTSNTTSPSITIEKNKFFLLPLCGFNDPNTDNLRLQKIFTITGDNLVYSVSQWYGQFTPCTFLEVQIPFGFITITKALKVSHLQIAGYEDSFQILNSNFQIKIKEINQIYQDYGTFQTVLDEITNTVNIDILIKCSKNNKITSKFNYCGTCSNQGRYEFNRSCYGSMNRYYLRSRFQTSFLAKKSLIITITSQNLLVTQLVYSDGSNSVQMQLDIIQMSLENV